MKTMRIILLNILILTLPAFGPAVSAQAPDSEIFVFSLEQKDDGLALSGGKNITARPGYDNQPSFSAGGGSVLYTSSRKEGDFDIYEHDLATGRSVPLVVSPAGEYTARELEAGTVTFVREGPGQAMTVWKYDRTTKKETPALGISEPVAYYAFNRKGDALVWVRYAFMVHWVNPEAGVNRYVADHAQPSVPHLIPGTDRFSFMQRQPNDELWIREFDPATQAVRPLVRSRDEKKDYCWTPDGSILQGSGSKLYRFDPRKDRNWILVADLKEQGIEDITRLAVSPDGRRLALVDNR